MYYKVIWNYATYKISESFSLSKVSDIINKNSRHSHCFMFCVSQFQFSTSKLHKILELKYLRLWTFTGRPYSSRSPVLSPHRSWIITTYLSQWFGKGDGTYQICRLSGISSMTWENTNFEIWILKKLFHSSWVILQDIKHYSCCIKFSVLLPWPLASVHITLH